MNIINNYLYKLRLLELEEIFPVFIMDIILEYMALNTKQTRHRAGLQQIKRFVQLISYQESVHADVSFCAIQCLALLIGSYVTTQQLREFGILSELTKLTAYLSKNSTSIDDKQSLLISAALNLTLDYIYFSNHEQQIIELMDYKILLPLISVTVKTQILSKAKMKNISKALKKVKVSYGIKPIENKQKLDQLCIHIGDIYDDKNVELGNKRILRQWLNNTTNHRKK